MACWIKTRAQRSRAWGRKWFRGEWCEEPFFVCRQFFHTSSFFRPLTSTENSCLQASPNAPAITFTRGRTPDSTTTSTTSKRQGTSDTDSRDSHSLAPRLTKCCLLRVTASDGRPCFPLARVFTSANTRTCPWRHTKSTSPPRLPRKFRQSTLYPRACKAIAATPSPHRPSSSRSILPQGTGLLNNG